MIAELSRAEDKAAPLIPYKSLALGAAGHCYLFYLEHLKSFFFFLFLFVSFFKLQNKELGDAAGACEMVPMAHSRDCSWCAAEPLGWGILWTKQAGRE